MAAERAGPLICTRCDSENRAHRRFCAECGAPLPRACPSCGFANAPGERFCGGCGDALARSDSEAAQRAPRVYTPHHLAEKILTSAAALKGERKQVTVHFVDISGFASLSERLDPEDVHATMTRTFELLLDAVHRYEGTVNQFLSDGIMALFGAPIAHEDHAQRAVLEAEQSVRAAAGILERVRSKVRDPGLAAGLAPAQAGLGETP